MGLLCLSPRMKPDMRQSSDGARGPSSFKSQTLDTRSFLNDSEHQVVALGQVVLEKHRERPLVMLLESFGQA